MKNTNRFWPWVNLLLALKFTLLFALFQGLLPFAVFPQMPLHGFLGGLFVDLSMYQLFWATVGYLAIVWALMFLVILAVMGHDERVGSSLPGHTGGQDSSVHRQRLPDFAVEFFAAPVTMGQFLAFTALALPAIVISIVNSGSGAAHVLVACLVALLAALLAYLLCILMSMPVLSVYGDFRILPGPIAKYVYQLQPKLRLGFIWRSVYRLVSAQVAKRRWLHYLADKELRSAEGELVLDRFHFFALAAVPRLLIAYAVLAIVFYPFRDWSVAYAPPALTYLYGLLTLLLCLFQFVDFHMGRLGFSAPVVCLAWMAFVYGAFQSSLLAGVMPPLDHYFYVFDRAQVARLGASPALTPVAVAQANRESENLVIITATGGGIQAAGWITYSLGQLINVHGVERKDIRLLSTVSGGSVGAAFYLDALRGRERGDSLGPEFDAEVYSRSVSSSLRAVTYALANVDFWTMLLGPLAFWSKGHDRGMLIERRWAKSSNGHADAASPSLQSLGAEILAGELPAVILNATALETGRRIMITPVEFSPRQANGSLSEEASRSQTLYELLTTPCKDDPIGGDARAEDLDLGLWTAARLSASFSYVSPAARAMLDPKRPSQQLDADHDELRGFHLIDGGYYDNYGVASAMDFLEPVLQARLDGNSGLTFKHVLIIQLRSSHASDPADVSPDDGFIAAMAGPIQGILNIRDGAAFTRNEEDLSRFISRWSALFADKFPLDQEFKFKTIVFEPPAGAQPLTWHLTAEEKQALKQPWQQKDAFSEELRTLREVLGTPPNK